MTLVERAQGMILKPKDTWPKVVAEPDTVQSLFMGYIIPLSAIGPIAQFIGLSFIGMNVLGVSYRVPVVSGLITAVMQYVLALVGCYISAMIASELAPNFGGTKGLLQGLKLVAFSSTAVWVASILSILPLLGILVLIAGLY